MQDRHWWNKSLKPQVPPLRYASVGMTKGGVVTFIRSCQIGWTEEKPQVPTGAKRSGGTCGFDLSF